jgi:hypothetical protein
MGLSGLIRWAELGSSADSGGRPARESCEVRPYPHTAYPQGAVGTVRSNLVCAWGISGGLEGASSTDLGGAQAKQVDKPPGECPDPTLAGTEGATVGG